VISNLQKAVMLGAALAVAGPAAAQQAQTPKSWSYDVNQHGQRINRSNRVTNPDGSWREEIRQGNCVTVKERSAAGEYKETRQCSPGTAAKPQ
jgi:hypothetical protein